MFNLIGLLDSFFTLHGAIPRWWRKDGYAFSPIHMMMEVTFHCNLRCNFCQYLEIIENKIKPYGPSSRDLPLADILRYIDELPRGRLISFTGGETLVRKDFPEILSRAAEHHRVHIVTNGSLIDESIARRYIDLAPRRVWQNGLVLIGVSLEGAEAQHDAITGRPGSWRRSIDAIGHLIRWRNRAGKRFPKLDLKLVVNRDTYRGLVEFMELARDVGVDVVNFIAENELIKNAEAKQLHRPQPKSPDVDAALLRRELIRCYELGERAGIQIRLLPNVPIDEMVRHFTDDRSLDPAEYQCEGLWSRLGIKFDGRYTPMCPYLADGDMREESIATLWNSERLRSFRVATHRARVYPGCHGCCNLKYTGPRKFGLAGIERLQHPSGG
ncbi:MAG TPA: radical SAM protein [Terriglobales bacterium]|nr:radical SAM protein [Terriglobales bacterium]